MCTMCVQVPKEGQGCYTPGTGITSHCELLQVGAGGKPSSFARAVGTPNLPSPV